MKTCKADELFDKAGRQLPDLAALAPKGERRLGSNRQANGGLLLSELQLPGFREYGVQVSAPGAAQGQDTPVLGGFLRDVAKLNQNQRNFRLFGPDETVSNLLGAVFEEPSRQWDAELLASDGCPSLAHRLIARRTNRQLHVHGFAEEGTITTGRDMRVQNEPDRFHLVPNAVECLPLLSSAGAYLKQMGRDKLIQHKHDIDQDGQDLPENRDWKWGDAR